ncbi:hypothetical protein BKA70DRAFT_536781 [Coprinopsis sp. MPI-PUGE-AT-0042]|nr:hypothetical protein BKA70DRAFT_536781 [Coprinopsis sp. MPI-PUGE-AT-0042]
MAPSATPCQCCAHGQLHHSLARCGCPYEGEAHAKHPIDDAHHRVWCTVCLKYCEKDPKCPAVLPKLCLVQHRKGFKDLIKSSCKALMASLYIFAAVRTWASKGILSWLRKPIQSYAKEKLAAHRG